MKRLNFSFDSVIALLAGLGFIIGGFVVNGIAAREAATMREATGRVVAIEARRETDPSDSSKTREVFAPVIEFAANGDPARFTGNAETFRTSIGTVKAVRYDPARPAATAKVIEPFEGLTPYAMWGMGGFAFVVGLRALFKRGT